MEDQWGNVGQAPLRLPSTEDCDKEFMDVLSDKVNHGWVLPPYSDMVKEADILAHEPWELPEMHPTQKSGWYFWKRKPKTERAKKIDRVIKSNAGNSRWHEWDKEEIWDNDSLWGEKRSFRHIRDGKKTGWLMKEYVLHSSRVEVGKGNHIAFCRIYKKKQPPTEPCTPIRSSSCNMTQHGHSFLCTLH